MSIAKSISQTPRIIAFITQAQGQVVLAVIALCLIVIFSVSNFLYRPYDGMALLATNGGVVSAIYVPGPANSAGFKVGDRILAVDGTPVDPWMQRPVYPAGLHAGDVVKYQVERNGQILDISLTLGSYLSNLSLLAALLGMTALGVIFWIIGLLLCLFAPLDDLRARLIGLCWLLAGISAAAGGPGNQSHFWGAATAMKVSWALLGFTLVAAHTYFPTPTFSIKRRGLLLNILAILALVIAVVDVVDDFYLKPAGISLEGIGLTYSRVIYAWFFVTVLFSIFLLLRSRFRSQDPEARRQTGIVLWAMVLGFGPFFILTLVPLLFAGSGAVAADGSYTSLFLVLIPLAYAYVIHQRRLLRIDAIVNRLLVFFVLMIGALVTSFVVLGLLALLLKLPPQFPLFGSLAAAVIALPSSFFERKVQVQVNRTLYGTYYDHATVTASLSVELSRAVDRLALTRLLTENLCAQMGVRQAALYLVEDADLCLQNQQGDPDEIPLSDELCQTLQQSDQPVRGQNLWLLVPEVVQERWSGLSWGQIFVPIVYEKDLVGLLVLGGRTTGDMYSAQDVGILGTVAHQAALAVANMQLMENLRGLNRSLVFSEDERRKDLANELHDLVLQDLFFLKNQASHLEAGKDLEARFDQLIQRIRETIRKQRPDLLNAPLPVALKGLSGEMDRLSGEDGPRVIWKTNLQDDEYFPELLKTAVYRIAQEALMNAIKHSKGRRVEISLDRGPSDLIDLCVQDDGVGFKGSVSGAGGLGSHFGLVILRERAAMIGGEIRIESQPHQGTLVELKVHYDGQRPNHSGN